MTPAERTRPVALSHPARLQARAQLYGLRDGSLDGARLLELGCGEGGNLLPMAARLPEMQFVGLDSDGRRLEQAVADAARCDIDNARFVVASDFAPAEAGPFDFVLSHGLYSWIAEAEQRRLLEIMARALAPRGVALLSYNTLPGWALRGVVRDLMLQAVGGAAGGEAITRARSRLTQLRRQLPEGNHPYTAMLAAELGMAAGASDEALLGDLLCPHNEALYVDELAARAAEVGLDYLDEMLPASPDGALELELPAKLQAEGLSPLEAQRCLDVTCYRQHRATLLCRADAPRRATPDWAVLAEVGWFAGKLQPRAAEPLLGPGEPLAFATERGAVIEADRPLLKAALMALADGWPAGLRAQPLIAEAVDRLRVRGLVDGQGAGHEAVEQTLSDLVALCQRGQLELSCWSPPLARVVAERPRAQELARLEAERGQAVSSPRHELLLLDPVGRAVVGLLDGSRDFEALSLAVGQLIDGGALALDGALPAEGRAAALRAVVLQRVVALRDWGLLAPEAKH